MARQELWVAATFASNQCLWLTFMCYESMTLQQQVGDDILFSPAAEVCLEQRPTGRLFSLNLNSIVFHREASFLIHGCFLQQQTSILLWLKSFLDSAYQNLSWACLTWHLWSDGISLYQEVWFQIECLLFLLFVSLLLEWPNYLGISVISGS